MLPPLCIRYWRLSTNPPHTRPQCIASDTTYNYVLQVRVFLVQSLLTANYPVRINSGIGFSPASTAPARGTLASRRWTSRHSSDATYASHSSARRDVTIFICSCSSRSQALLVGHSMTTLPAKSSWRRTLAFAPYSLRSALQTSRSLRTLRAIIES